MKKYLLLFLTLLPLVYLIFFMEVVMSSVLRGIQEGGSVSLGWFMPIVFVLHPLVMLLMIGLMIFYIHHLYRKTHMPADRRVLWLLLIVFTSMIGMTIYWYKFIFKNEVSNTAVPDHTKL